MTTARHYYATYTAYNGRAILPQLLETTDFLNSVRSPSWTRGAKQRHGVLPAPHRWPLRDVSRQDDENLS